MQPSEIVRIDERFRIVIPKTIRDSLGLVQGMYLLLNVNLERREAKLIPFADPDAKSIIMNITMKDVLGSLAKIASILAELKIDLLLGESRIIQRKKIAQWYIVADISNCKLDLETIKKAIIEKGEAENVEFLEEL